jgi:bifunctional ADP-heptose synthase (sugar kinase/adenylyltransferase)
VLSALACVDHVVPFGDDTPVALVAALRPDVYCKGGDYARDELPEAEVVERAGGEVVILPFLGRHSTTRTLERVRGGA